VPCLGLQTYLNVSEALELLAHTAHLKALALQARFGAARYPQEFHLLMI